MRDIRNVLLTLTVVFLIVGTAAAADPVRGTLPFYWINGTVLDTNGATPAADRTVIFYQDDLSKFIWTTTDKNGKYRLNAYELYYYQGVDITLGSGTFKLACPQVNNIGAEKILTLTADVGYMTGYLTLAEGVGPKMDPPEITTASLPNGKVGAAYSAQLEAIKGLPPYSWSIEQGGSLPKGLTLAITGLIAGLPEEAASSALTIKLTDAAGNSSTKSFSIKINATQGTGPGLAVKVLLQGLYNPDTKTQKPATIIVEARSGNSPKEATTLAGQCTIPLSEIGNGSNAYAWDITPPDGDYYLVIKQKIPGTNISPHLPIISSVKHTLSSALILSIDFTSDNFIYSEPGSFPATASIGGDAVLWAGDINGNGYVDVIDVGNPWFYLFSQFNKGTPEQDLDPQFPTYKIADLNGDTYVDVIDVGNPWFAGFSWLKNYNGPHTYVPVIQE